MLAFALDDPPAAEPVLDRALERHGAGALVATRGALLCAVVDAAGRDPIELARRLRRELAAELGDVRAAASRTGGPRRCGAASTRRGAPWRPCATPTAAAPRSPPTATSAPSISSSPSRTTTPCASYSDSVLGPLAAGEAGYGEELLRSLDVFLEHNGHWERAAAELYCHRHTLRYRLRRVERLTGRDLSSTRDRIEFWLALRGRELAR